MSALREEIRSDQDAGGQFRARVGKAVRALPACSTAMNATNDADRSEYFPVTELGNSAAEIADLRRSARWTEAIWSKNCAVSLYITLLAGILGASADRD